MEISQKQIFNLWDTNGRRSDILEALHIYLSIIKEMCDEGSFDEWASYPTSLTQLSFYKKAIERSPDVFKTHPQFDNFVSETKMAFDEFHNFSTLKIKLQNNNQLMSILDKAIEQRARHYTSNLVRFGLTNEDRKISPCGQIFLKKKTNKDILETFLPLNDVNIIFLRQMMKLKIFTKNIDGKRYYYSPFFAALFLVFRLGNLSKQFFCQFVQGLNPYKFNYESVNDLLKKDIDEIVEDIVDVDIKTPVLFSLDQKISIGDFNFYIKNRKSTSVQKCYYEFYDALYKFKLNNNNENYEKLKNVYFADKDKIKKAFCLGKNIFDFGVYGTYSLSEFLLNNVDNIFLKFDNLNSTFYEYYEKSKYVDQIYEYSDTTRRALSATGIFKFKPSVSLINEKLIKILFSKTRFEKLLFGAMTEEQYLKYEKGDKSIYGNNISFIEILEYSEKDVLNILELLQQEYKTDNADSIKAEIETRTSHQFLRYINENYPKEKVINLLKLVSDRNNDLQLKQIVSETASVPTIYEYLVGIAWYYILDKDFDLYASYNLTLNGDFEPEMHAGGGIGDIIINYRDKCIMVEATLMSNSGQRRSEREPVLRHSLNNKAENLNRETFTFFVADDLDFNTINIWRAVAAVPLRSTNGSLMDVSGVIIMPFKNSQIIEILENDIPKEKIFNEVKESFKKVPKITDKNWHQEIMNKINEV